MIKHRINSEFDAKLVEGITNLFGGVKNRLKEVGGNVTKAVESVVDNVAAGIDNPEQLNNPDESVESTTIEFGSPSPKAARRDELDKIRTSHAVALSAKQLEIDALKERLLKGQEADEGDSSEEATELQKQLEQKDGVIESMKEQIALQQRQLEQAGAQITSLAGKEERSALEDERRNGALMELEKKLGVREEEVRRQHSTYYMLNFASFLHVASIIAGQEFEAAVAARGDANTRRCPRRNGEEPSGQRGRGEGAQG